MDNNNFNTETFDAKVFNSINFNMMRLYRNELSKGVKDSQSFTTMVCNGIIGILTPWAISTVYGKFVADGACLNAYIKQVKKILNMKYNFVINIDNNKKYVIDNSMGEMIMVYETV